MNNTWLWIRKWLFGLVIVFFNQNAIYQSIRRIRFLWTLWVLRREIHSWIVLGKITDDEKYICKVKKAASLNFLLLEKLERLNTFYEKYENEVTLSPSCYLIIYDLMRIVIDHIRVYEQMLAVKSSEQSLIKQHEYETHRI